MKNEKPPISEAIEVSKSFFSKAGATTRSGKRSFIQAVDRCSISIAQGSSVGLVGESGCGKSTLGRLLLRLESPTAGRIFFNNQDITDLKRTKLQKQRGQMQMIFQDPSSSLNPRFTVEDTITEAILTHKKKLDLRQLNAHLAALLSMVGLPVSSLKKYPHEFSVGEKQRISIARSLAVEPRFLIADEPIAALDLASQEQITELLSIVKRELGVSLLLIAHDMDIIKKMCSFVAVMYLGRIIEYANTKNLFEKPAHPYTKALLMSQISSNTLVKKNLTLLPGDPPSPLSPPSGCHFHPRCPYSDIQCEKLVPQTRILDDNHSLRCHFDIVDNIKLTPKTQAETLSIQD